MTNQVGSMMAAALLAVSVGAVGAPTVTPLGGDNYQISFDPVTFNIAVAGQIGALVFEDFFASAQPSVCGIYVSGTVDASLNGGATQALRGFSCTGALDGFRDVDSNDLLVTFSIDFDRFYGSVAVGDSFAVSNPVNHVFNFPGLRPASTTGPWDAFLVNNSAVRVSEIARVEGRTVPAPGTLALLSLGLLGVGFRRQRSGT